MSDDPNENHTHLEINQKEHENTGFMNFIDGSEIPQKTLCATLLDGVDSARLRECTTPVVCTAGWKIQIENVMLATGTRNGAWIERVFEEARRIYKSKEKT